MEGRVRCSVIHFPSCAWAEGVKRLIDLFRSSLKRFFLSSLTFSLPFIFGLRFKLSPILVLPPSPNPFSSSTSLHQRHSLADPHAAHPSADAVAVLEPEPRRPTAYRWSVNSVRLGYDIQALRMVVRMRKCPRGR